MSRLSMWNGPLCVVAALLSVQFGKARDSSSSCPPAMCYQMILGFS